MILYAVTMIVVSHAIAVGIRWTIEIREQTNADESLHKAAAAAVNHADDADLVICACSVSLLLSVLDN